MAAARIGVLVALPRHPGLVAYVRPQHLPVEARVLQEHLSKFERQAGVRTTASREKKFDRFFRAPCQRRLGRDSRPSREA